MNKLEHYGVRGVGLSLFSSFLHDRSQYVSINNSISCKQNISCGVPQGSVLGPFLFTLYINNIASISSTNPRLFVDDTCLVLNDKKLENLQTKIRTEVTKISKWLIANKLKLNLSKSNVMIIDPIKLKYLKNSCSDFTKLANIDMENVNLGKYLGITLDKDLSFKFHINNLITKLSRSVGILAKARPFLTNSTILKLYYTLFHTHLTYGLIVWGSTFKSYVNKLSTLQNKAVKIIG